MQTSINEPKDQFISYLNKINKVLKEKVNFLKNFIQIKNFSVKEIFLIVSEFKSDKFKVHRWSNN